MTGDRTPNRCDGPLFWFDAAESGAVLECAGCGFITTTGNLLDDRHVGVPLMREGLAT